MTVKTQWRLWQPPGETIDAIASVLGTHWAAAKSLQPGGQFWARPANWLCKQATRLVDRASASGGKMLTPRSADEPIS